MSDIDIAGLEDFELVEAGGFGLVYRAYQPHFERTVAVKVLQTRVTDDQLQHQFRRECAAAGRLTGHPHIVTVFDAGFTSEGRPYLVMEWMDGGSLDDHLRGKGPLGPRAVVTIGSKVAGALAAAHFEGVLHRDVKPANILISRYGEPELADFGIASLGTATGLSASLYALTPVHAAPEVLEGTKASPASDVYSLASTLWTLLTGEAPFAGPPDEAVVPMVMRILRSDPPALERPDIPAELVAVLEHAMAKAPADRPASAAAFASELHASLDAMPAPPRATTVVKPAGSPETDDPGGDAPGGDEPATDDLEADDPETDDPEADDPETDEPGGDDPETDEPGEPESETDEPGGDEPEAPAPPVGPVPPAAVGARGGADDTEVILPPLAARRRTRKRGVVIATAAVVVVVLLVVGAALAFWPGGDTAGDSGADADSATPPRRWPPGTGDCLVDSDPTPGSFEPITVSCDDPHVSEVAAVFLVSTQGTPYPGVEALSRGTHASPCTADVYDRYLDASISTRTDLVASEIQPDAQSWADGRAIYVCVIEHPGGALTSAKLGG